MQTVPFMKSLLASINHALQDLDNLPEEDWRTMREELKEMAEATQTRIDQVSEPPAECWNEYDEAFAQTLDRDDYIPF